MGAGFTSQTIPIKEVCDAHHFPMLSYGATGLQLTAGANNEWFWRVKATDGQFNQIMFTFLKELQKKTGVEIKTMGIIYANDSFGTGWRDNVVNTVNKDPQLGGYDIISELPVVVDTPSIDSEVLTLKKNLPDVLHDAMHASDTILLTKALRQYDINTKLFIDEAGEISYKAYGDAVGKLADGQTTRSPGDPDVNKAITKEFNDKFKAKYGEDLHDLSSVASMQVATLMFENVQEPSVAPEVIQRSFNSLYVPAEEMIVPWGVKFWPPGTYDAGQNILAGGSVLQYTGAYDLHTVWPFDVASKDIVFPVPSWTARGL